MYFVVSYILIAPGCGKSSFISALAGSLHYNICVLNLNERGLTDDRLAALLSQVPAHSFILLEDIDAALPAVRPGSQQSERYSYSVTFSGLLNVLDGVASGEERIIFMTTNHRDRLDTALIRPGRVDVQQYIGMATKYQLYTMFNRFYPNNDNLAKQFVDIITNVNAELSVAELQSYFLIHKTDVNMAVKEAYILAQQALLRQQQQVQQQDNDNMISNTSHTASVSSATRL